MVKPKHIAEKVALSRDKGKGASKNTRILYLPPSAFSLQAAFFSSLQMDWTSGRHD
jgi:hypothetical protein